MAQGDTTGAAGDAQLAALAGVLRPLLRTLDALQFVARHLHPPHLEHLIAQVGDMDAPLNDGLAAFRAIAWPDGLASFTDRIETSADLAAQAIRSLREATAQPEGIVPAYRAIRLLPRALEALYPLAAGLPPVSRYFVDEAMRDDEALAARLRGVDAAAENVGVMHANNERDARGGFSLYVPEYYDPAQAYPLIMALHGGTGHGRVFLWSWLREARSRGAILLSPTARGDTWSLMGPDHDSENLEAMVASVTAQWNVDASRMLLTGMSDGGTFTFVSGLRSASPFTHLAPIAASFHPMMLDFIDEPRYEKLPIYLIHGLLDWMFGIEIARTANQVLSAAGADVVYREIADLSHTYPRDENPRILDWFLG